MPSFAKATKGILLSPLGAMQNGDDRDRTCNLRLAKPALSQLSYIPETAAAEIRSTKSKILNKLKNLIFKYSKYFEHSSFGNLILFRI